MSVLSVGCGQLIGLDEFSAGSQGVAGPDGGSETPSGYVRIDPGSFLMGSPPAEVGRSSDETEHTVTVTRAFWLQSHEVTQGQWAAVVGENPSWFQACGEQCPVEMIRWFEAAAFCNLLSSRDGLPACYMKGASPYSFDDAAVSVQPEWPEGLACMGYRLPTEAEWEYAARAGSTAAFSSGPIGQDGCADPTLDQVGWYCGNSAVTYAGCEDATSSGGAPCAGPHPGGGKAANAWGLHDVHGNVWEWVWDGYGAYEGDAADPVGPTESELKVGRGGFWYGAARYCRAARRFTGSPAGRTNYLGVRIARTVP